MSPHDPSHVCRRSCVSLSRRAILNLLPGVIAVAVSDCAGPPVLEQQVLGYDEVTKTVDDKLLLLNIARVANIETVHFTSTSSIAATFNWTATLGAGGQIEKPNGPNIFNFNIGGSASENPTFSISPLSGEDFTKRIATPFQDSNFEFLVSQGGRINQIMRLMAGGIEVQKPDGSFLRFIENDPRRWNEYAEFRRIAAELQRLNDNRQLFVRPLVFEETLIADYKIIPRPEDINNGFDKGLRWRQRPNGHYDLTRLKGGRVAVTNFDPMALTNQQRAELQHKIEKNPSGFVYLDIQRGRPGGHFPLTGAIKLRSMFQIFIFVARGIYFPEFAVSLNPGTEPLETGPAATLKINITDSPPDHTLPTVYYEGRYYSLNDTAWDRGSFLLLGLLFQMAVGPIQSVGIPITIAK